jgi:hypothetical protein
MRNIAVVFHRLPPILWRSIPSFPRLVTSKRRYILSLILPEIFTSHVCAQRNGGNRVDSRSVSRTVREYTDLLSHLWQRIRTRQWRCEYCNVDKIQQDLTGLKFLHTAGRWHLDDANYNDDARGQPDSTMQRCDGQELHQ